MEPHPGVDISENRPPPQWVVHRLPVTPGLARLTSSMSCTCTRVKSSSPGAISRYGYDRQPLSQFLRTAPVVVMPLVPVAVGSDAVGQMSTPADKRFLSEGTQRL